MLQGTDSFWAAADTVTSVLVNLTVLAGAVAAVIKFRLLHLFGRRYRSELLCTHHAMSNGRTIFIGDYSVNNTGDRPISVSSVTLRLHPAVLNGVLLVPNRDSVIAERVHGAADIDKRGLFQIEPGERSIFTLRCDLPELDPVVFLSCQLAWPDRRDPAPYVGMYVRQEMQARPGPAA